MDEQPQYSHVSAGPSGGRWAEAAKPQLCSCIDGSCAVPVREGLAMLPLGYVISIFTAANAELSAAVHYQQHVCAETWNEH